VLITFVAERAVLCCAVLGVAGGCEPAHTGQADLLSDSKAQQAGVLQQT
jgi:hypothetical protein